MLRVSAQNSETDIDLQVLKGDEQAAAVGILYGVELMRFAEAFASRDEAALLECRDALYKVAGAAVVVDAAGVAANFQRMTRIADSTGIPIDNVETALGQEIRAQLGLNEFAGARNTFTEQGDS